MLTGGAVMESFMKNPVLLFNHIRPEGNLKNQILPLGHWQDIRVEGDEITGAPFFDDKDEFAMQIFHKVEGGHIRMCSAGAEPLETSKKKADLLPGQKLETVTKWIMKEASICDIGANPDALDVALYDKNDRLIRLSETPIETLIPKINMAKKTTTAADAFAALTKANTAKKAAGDAIKLAQSKVELALADEDTSDEDKEKLTADSEEEEKLSDDEKDEKISELTQKLADMEKQCNELQEKLSEQEADAENKKAETLADKGVAMRKLTHAQRADFVKLAKSDYSAAEKFLAGIKSSPSIKGSLDTTESAGGDENAEKIKKLSSKSWDELFKENGATTFLKLNAPDVYKAKYKAKFGKEPKNL